MADETDKSDKSLPERVSSEVKTEVQPTVKIDTINNKPKEFHFLKTVATSFTVVAAVAGLSWFVWQASSSHHRAEIESLQQTLATVTETYKTLSLKTEGLFEPMLLFADTLRLRKNKTVDALGGRIEFHVYPTAKYVSVNYHNKIDSESFLIRLRPNERFDFQAKQKDYYLIFTYLSLDDSTVIGKVYELYPIYRPEEMLQSNVK